MAPFELSNLGDRPLAVGAQETVNLLGRVDPSVMSHQLHCRLNGGRSSPVHVKRPGDGVMRLQRAGDFNIDTIGARPRHGANSAGMRVRRGRDVRTGPGNVRRGDVVLVDDYWSRWRDWWARAVRRLSGTRPTGQLPSGVLLRTRRQVVHTHRDHARDRSFARDWRIYLWWKLQRGLLDAAFLGRQRVEAVHVDTALPLATHVEAALGRAHRAHDALRDLATGRR